MSSNASAAVRAARVLAFAINQNYAARHPGEPERFQREIERIAASSGRDPLCLYLLWEPIIFSDEPRLALSLIEAGASANYAPEGREFPLGLAISAGSRSACRALLAAGADPNAPVANAPGKERCLQMALRMGLSTIALLLIRHGCDPLYAGPRGVTYLHTAVDCNNSPVAAALLAQGADPLAAMEGGHTPLSMAQDATHFGCADLLRSAVEERALAAAMPPIAPSSRPLAL